MNESTREFIAVELLTLLATVLSSLVLTVVLSQIGIAVRISYVALFLYLCRWVWWAMRYCRSHPHLHGVAGRVIGWIAAMVCLIGVAIALIGLRNGGYPLAIAGLLLAAGGVGLIAWMSKALPGREKVLEVQDSADSPPQHFDS